MTKPLPPLEYCRIERAARLLDCEVEDIFHWGAESKIRLYVAGESVLFNEDDIWLFDCRSPQQIEASQPSLGLADVEKPIRVRINELSSYARSPETDIRKTTPLGTLMQGNLLPIGLWQLPVNAIRARYILGVSTIEDLNLVALGSTPNLPDKDGGDAKPGFVLMKHVELPSNYDTWITKAELDTLREHILTGSRLPDLSDTPTPPELTEDAKARVTATQSRMIKTLLQLIPGIDYNKLADNPHTLLKRLQELCASKGITCPVQDGKTLAAWLEKAK